MRTTLADACFQLAMIVIATAGLVGLLVGFELLRGGWEEWRYSVQEQRMLNRVSMRRHTAERFTAAELHARRERR